MQQLIDDELDEGMKQAYREMLQGCKEHPKQRIWNVVWNIFRGSFRRQNMRS